MISPPFAVAAVIQIWLRGAHEEQDDRDLPLDCITWLAVRMFCIICNYVSAALSEETISKFKHVSSRGLEPMMISVVQNESKPVSRS